MYLNKIIHSLSFHFALFKKNNKIKKLASRYANKTVQTTAVSC